jgi:hypothetical protein
LVRLNPSCSIGSAKYSVAWSSYLARPQELRPSDRWHLHLWQCLSPLWGWVDQKNEAIDLLKGIRKSFKKQVPHASIRTRRQLVIAAHTTIIIAAYFESLRKNLGDLLISQVEVTEKEKRRLVSRVSESDEDLFRQLYIAEAPYPSAARGFNENVELVRDWMKLLASRPGAEGSARRVAAVAVSVRRRGCAGAGCCRSVVASVGDCAGLP